MKAFFCTFSLLCLMCTCNLQGEIFWVKIKWTSVLCQESCVTGLQKQFEQLKGVSKININQGAGQAILTWKNNQPYSYGPINTAMRMIGLTIQDLRIRVRGKIFVDGQTFKLISVGDNTEFVLLSPINSMNLTQYSIEFSAANRQISGELKDKLLAAKKSNLAVTIEGVLFEPQRLPLTQLVIEQMTVDEANKSSSQKQPFQSLNDKSPH